MKLKQKITIGYLRVMLKMLAVVSTKRTAEKAFRLFCTPFTQSKSMLPALFRKAEKLELTMNENKVVGYRWNHPRPQKVLILHGFESSAKNFDRYVSLMIGKDYEVMAFDAPAHGESEGREINVLIYKSMIEAIHDRYGPIDAYLAHSFGGLAISLAMEGIMHNPQTRIVLIAPATETSTSLGLMYRFLQLNEKTRQEVERLIIKLAGKPVQWYSIARALQNIKARILWIHDKDDNITPFKDVDPVMKNNHENVEFIITRGLGHRRIYRDERVMQAVADFL